MVMDKDPIEPTRTLVTFLLAVTAAAVVLFAVAAASGFHSTCVVHGAFGQLVDERLRADSGARLRDGVSFYSNAARLCVADATVGQRLLSAVVDMSAHLFLLATLLLAVGMFRVMGKDGLFSDRAVRWLRVVGWVVLAGTPAVSALVASASAALLDSMLVSHPFDVLWIDHWEMSFTPIVLGIVLISLARVLRVSTRMREDLEGTV